MSRICCSAAAFTNAGRKGTPLDIWAGNACRCPSSCNDVCVCALADCLANGALNNVVSSSKAVLEREDPDLASTAVEAAIPEPRLRLPFSCLLLRDRTRFSRPDIWLMRWQLRRRGARDCRRTDCERLPKLRPWMTVVLVHQPLCRCYLFGCPGFGV